MLTTVISNVTKYTNLVISLINSCKHQSKAIMHEIMTLITFLFLSYSFGLCLMISGRRVGRIAGCTCDIWKVGTTRDKRARQLFYWLMAS